MDELRMIADLRPAPAADEDAVCQAARARLMTALTGPGGHGTHGRDRLRRRPILLAGVVAATAVAATILPAMAPNGVTSVFRTAAWSVTRGDGSITVTVQQLANLPELERVLRADGAPAYVRYVRNVTVQQGLTTFFYPYCAYEMGWKGSFPVAQIFSSVPAVPGRGAELVIHPGAIPMGAAVIIYVGRFGNGTGYLWAWSFSITTDGHLGPCVPNPAPLQWTTAARSS